MKFEAKIGLSLVEEPDPQSRSEDGKQTMRPAMLMAKKPHLAYYTIHVFLRVINIAFYYYTMPFMLVLFVIVYAFRFSYY